MDEAEMKELLEKWSARFAEIDAVWDRFAELTGADAESPLCNAIYASAEGYTEALSALVGDDFGWLDWYLWENGNGSAGREAGAASWDGEVRPIKSIDDLVALIVADRETGGGEGGAES